MGVLAYFSMEFEKKYLNINNIYIIKIKIFKYNKEKIILFKFKFRLVMFKESYIWQLLIVHTS